MDIDKKISELKGCGTPCCLATVVKITGSAPRDIGAKMVITADSSFGTIGGGALEHRVIADARDMLQHGTAELKTYPLGPLLGQCCGGEVGVFIEPVLAKREVIVFGAGHIACELCPMLVKLGYDVTLVDERKERIDLPEFATVSKKINELPGDILPKIRFHDGLHIVVITHQHKDDEEIVEYCLDKPFKYLGCIGSRTKWAKFTARYKSRGFTDGEFLKVTTPIGLDIGAESPFEIAVAITAQLIQLHAKPEDFKNGVGHFAKEG